MGFTLEVLSNAFSGNHILCPPLMPVLVVDADRVDISQKGAVHSYIPPLVPPLSQTFWWWKFRSELPEVTRTSGHGRPQKLYLLLLFIVLLPCNDGWKWRWWLLMLQLSVLVRVLDRAADDKLCSVLAFASFGSWGAGQVNGATLSKTRREMWAEVVCVCAHTHTRALVSMKWKELGCVISVGLRHYTDTEC